MFDKLRRIWREVASFEPGSRFREYYRLRRERESAHWLRNVLLIAVGATLVLAGFLLGFAPFLPGVVLGVPGLAILASCFYPAAALLDWCEVGLRRLLSHLKRDR